MSNIKNKLKQTDKKKNLVKKNLSVFQIILLIASIIAFSYILGSSLPVVSAQQTPTCSISSPTPPPGSLGQPSGPRGTTFTLTCQNLPLGSMVNLYLIELGGSSESELFYTHFTMNNPTFTFDIRTGPSDSAGDYQILIVSPDDKFNTITKTFRLITGGKPDGEPKQTQEPSTQPPTTQQTTASTTQNPVTTVVGEAAAAAQLGEKIIGGGKTGEETSDPQTLLIHEAIRRLNIKEMVDVDKAKELIAGGMSVGEAVKEAIIPGTEAVEGAAGGIFGTEITIGSLLTNAGYAAAIYAVVSFGLKGLFGVDPALANKIGGAAAIGYFAGWLSAQKGIGVASWVANAVGISVGLATLGIGLVVGFIAFILLGGFTKEDSRTVQFTCNLWDAPSGGKDCTKCNDGVFPCSEYRCKSLGQACELVNKGTDQELCVWVNRNDVAPPVIQPWDKALTTGYQYIPNNAIAPPDRGVKIVPQGNARGCIAAFTPLKLGITLDEPAKCKIGSVRKNNFDAMDTLFSGGRSLYNHSYQLSLPSRGALAAENITIPTGQDFSLYVRCQDKNGNSNVANFVFGFCVDEGPDTTPPIIVSTSIINGAPIAFNQTSIGLSVYVNEPAECRWSRTDLGYGDMENNMSCKTGVFQMNAQGLYECSTILNGLRDRVNNDFYLRCKDQPYLVGTANESKRNVNEESYKFTLKGTEPLYISSAKPNGTTIKDSTNIIKVVLSVETSAGYNKGEAICYYEGYGTGGNFNEFYTTSSHKHSQDLYLPQGNYTYNIRCVDLGGNADTTQVSFNIETDTQPPIVVRVYHEGQSLKIITNENATCVYNDNNNLKCEYGFDDGTKMGKSTDGRIHFTNWDKNKIFYIKCQDDFGNRPLPNQCSITAKPFEI